jgi:hypothetical protein
MYSCCMRPTGRGWRIRSCPRCSLPSAHLRSSRATWYPNSSGLVQNYGRGLVRLLGDDLRRTRMRAVLRRAPRARAVFTLVAISAAVPLAAWVSFGPAPEIPWGWICAFALAASVHPQPAIELRPTVVTAVTEERPPRGRNWNTIGRLVDADRQPYPGSARTTSRRSGHSANRPLAPRLVPDPSHWCGSPLCSRSAPASTSPSSTSSRTPWGTPSS